MALESNLNVQKEKTSWKRSGFPQGLFDLSLCWWLRLVISIQWAVIAYGCYSWDFICNVLQNMFTVTRKTNLHSVMVEKNFSTAHFDTNISFSKLNNSFLLY